MEWTKVDRNTPKGPKQTELDRDEANGQKCTEWTKVD